MHEADVGSALKILFDILPLRVVPPLMYGAIVYRLVGLVPEVATFWKFMLVLVLFNLSTASAVLLISVAFESQSVGSLFGTLVMLFKWVQTYSDIWIVSDCVSNLSASFLLACLSTPSHLERRDF